MIDWLIQRVKSVAPEATATGYGIETRRPGSESQAGEVGWPRDGDGTGTSPVGRRPGPRTSQRRASASEPTTGLFSSSTAQRPGRTRTLPPGQAVGRRRPRPLRARRPRTTRAALVCPTAQGVLSRVRGRDCCLDVRSHDMQISRKTIPLVRGLGTDRPWPHPDGLIAQPPRSIAGPCSNRSGVPFGRLSSVPTLATPRKRPGADRVASVRSVSWSLPRIASSIEASVLTESKPGEPSDRTTAIRAAILRSMSSPMFGAISGSGARISDRSRGSAPWG
jgi:hypothetical protein